MRSMEAYPRAAMERAMRVQDVMLQAMAKKITWWQAAEIIHHASRRAPHTSTLTPAPNAAFHADHRGAHVSLQSVMQSCNAHSSLALSAACRQSHFPALQFNL